MKKSKNDGKTKKALDLGDLKPIKNNLELEMQEMHPMEDWSRVVIETDEPNPKTLAIVTNDDFEVADGLRVRWRPVYD